MAARWRKQNANRRAMIPELPSERPRSRRARYWFLFAVALVEVAVLALLPFDAEPDTRFPFDCRGRLALVDDAVTHWATNLNRGTLDTPDEQALRPHLRWPWMLNCPQGGHYTLGSRELASTCDLHGHAAVYPAASAKPAATWLEELGNQLKNKLTAGQTPGHQLICVANLKVLDTASQSWALTERKLATNQVDAAGLLPFLRGGEMPHCPAGGKYLLRTVAESPACTARGHGI